MLYVVIDTNILRKDFFTRSGEFKVFKDYLKKTDSRLIMPAIVLEEIGALYKKYLTDKLGKFLTARKNLDNALMGRMIPEVEVDIHEETHKYTEYLLKEFGITQKSLLPHKPEYLDELVRRVVGRIKPISEKGEEFRDALVWLIILDFAGKTKEKKIVFVSTDKTDFADETGDLHPVLTKDATEKGVEVSFFNSLAGFNREQATKVEYINIDWLKSKYESLNIEEKLLRWIERSAMDKVFDIVESKESGLKPENISIEHAVFEIDDFYIYEMTDGSFYVEVYNGGDLDIYVEGVREFDEWGYDYGYDPIGGDFDYHYMPSTVRRRVSEGFTKSFYFTVGITVEEKEVTDYEIASLSFGYF